MATMTYLHAEKIEKHNNNNKKNFLYFDLCFPHGQKLSNKDRRIFLITYYD